MTTHKESQPGPSRCPSCGVSKQQILRHHNRRINEMSEELDAMEAARDLCKRQTADVEELRQWQVGHAQATLQSIEAHGRSGVWTAEDCATAANATLERMRSAVGSVPPGMQELSDAD